MMDNFLETVIIHRKKLIKEQQKQQQSPRRGKRRKRLRIEKNAWLSRMPKSVS
jgi:hypothetical protein